MHGTQTMADLIEQSKVWSRMIYEARTGTRKDKRTEAGISLRMVCLRSGAQ